MIKMNEEELLEELKSYIPEDYIRSCDTADGIGRYEINEDSWQYRVYVYILKLQNNWNELKKWLEEGIEYIDKIEYPDSYEKSEKATLKSTLRHMQELEGNNESN